MAISTAVVTGTTPTSTGTQNFTSSGFGTPQACIVVVSGANTTNNPESAGEISIGFTDGTTQWAGGVFAGDNLSSSNGKRSRQNSLCTLLNSSATEILSGTWSSWTTDGVTINFGTVDTLAYNITVYLIKGCTNVYVGSNINASGVNDITSPGFKPNLVYTLCTYSGSSTGTASHAMLSFGAAHNNSSDVVSQGYIGYSHRNAQTSDITNVVTDDAAAIGIITNDSEAFTAVAQDFDANGFSLNVTGGTGDNVYYLALDTGDTDGVDVSIVNSPTSTGTWNVEDPGFQPQSVILGLTPTTTAGTLLTADPMSFGVSIFDDTVESCSALDHDDAATTTDIQSNFSSSNAVQTYEYSGGHSKMHEGSFSSFDSLGYNLSFPTSVDGTARKWLSIAIKAPAAAGGRIMGSLAGQGGLAGHGGLAGPGGGLAG